MGIFPSFYSSEINKELLACGGIIVLVRAPPEFAWKDSFPSLAIEFSCELMVYQMLSDSLIVISWILKSLVSDSSMFELST